MSDTSSSDRFWIELFQTPLDVAAVDAFLRNARSGGIDIFVGTTRQWTDDRETDELAYDCYEPMALKEMQRLVDEAAAQWPIERVCVIHRLGVVPAAEASVVVGVATPHRAAAFEACRYLIDRLKVQVPIWKREHYTDGTTEWVQGDQPPQVTDG